MHNRAIVFAVLLTAIGLFQGCYRPLHVVERPEVVSIREGLKSRDLNTRLAAVEKLSHRNDDEAVSLLMSVAGNRREDWGVQIRAIQLLGEAKNPKATALLLDIFTSHASAWECPAIKSYTAKALGNFGGQPGVTDAIINGLQDGEPLTREASVEALGTIGDEKAVPHLVMLLQDGSIAIRLGAIKSLESIGNSYAIPALQRAAENDSDEDVRNAAKSALRNFRKG